MGVRLSFRGILIEDTMAKVSRKAIRPQGQAAASTDAEITPRKVTAAITTATAAATTPTATATTTAIATATATEAAATATAAGAATTTAQ